MALETAKSQAAVGAGAIAAIITQGIFQLWPSLVGQAWVETVVTLVLTLAASGWGAWQARNKLTPMQVAVAVNKGDIEASAVVAAASTSPEAMKRA